MAMGVQYSQGHSVGSDILQIRDHVCFLCEQIKTFHESPQLFHLINCVVV